MIDKMASGHLSMVLAQHVTARDFPSLAEKWSTQLGAKFHHEAYNFDVRLWEVELSGELFYLSWDIWQNALTLESRSANGDEIIKNLKIE